MHRLHGRVATGGGEMPKQLPQGPLRQWQGGMRTGTNDLSWVCLEIEVLKLSILQLRPWLLVITGDFNGMRNIL